MDVTVTVDEKPGPAVLGEARAFLDSMSYSARWLMAPGAALVLARHAAGLPCGLGVATLDGSTALLMSFAVQPEIRRHGIGRLMAESMLSHLRSSGARTAYLFSSVSGEFWERIGFCRTGVEEVATQAQNHFQVREFRTAGSLWNDTAYRRALDGGQ